MEVLPIPKLDLLFEFRTGTYSEMPGWLTEGKIQDEAGAEIEGFLTYIKGK